MGNFLYGGFVKEGISQGVLDKFMPKVREFLIPLLRHDGIVITPDVLRIGMVILPEVDSPVANLVATEFFSEKRYRQTGLPITEVTKQMLMKARSISSSGWPIGVMLKKDDSFSREQLSRTWDSCHLEVLTRYLTFCGLALSES